MPTMSVDQQNLERIGKAMQAAWLRVKRAQSKLWSEWMIIGDGLLEGRKWAMYTAGVNRPEGKGYVMAYGEWLKRYKVDDMDKSDRAKLLQLMEERAAVEEWRDTLTDYERRNLNNPTLVWRKWQAATRVKKPRSRTAGFSASEMGRARDAMQQQAERIRELEEEAASARDQNKTPETLDHWCGELIAAMTDAVGSLSEKERPDFFRRVRKALKALEEDHPSP
jgi:hypothetical protein